MNKLFKKMLDTEKKTIRREILISKAEDVIIRNAAFARNLTVSDFIRRTALGRRTDVDFDVQIVLNLRNVVQSVRQLHAAFVDQGLPIPREELGSLIDASLAAMLRIER